MSTPVPRALALVPLFTLGLGCAREASAPQPPVSAPVVLAAQSPAPSAAPAPAPVVSEPVVDLGARVDARFGTAKGCLLVQDLDSGELFERGGDECGIRTLPASTFKIPNAIIGLDLGIFKDENTMYRWDKTPRWNSAWNRDHTLASAIRNSVVWYFQKEADQVGTARYRSYLAAFHYGNEDASGPVRMFWLNSKLLISPREQLRFMNDLYTDKLAAKPRSTKLVRQMLEFRGQAVADELRDRFPFVDAIPEDVVFSGKTGSSAPDVKDGAKPDVVAWFVGAYEGRGRRLVFACRLRSDDEQRMGPAAAKLVYDHLHEDRHFL